MEVDSEKRRQWLTLVLEAPFYKPCKIHGDKKSTFFCFDCMGSTFCKFCNHKQNKGHRGIPVLRASRETAVCRKDIRSLVDTSEIQKYKINKNEIAYLKQRRREGYECKQVPSAKYCAMCRWILDADSYNEAYIYCSIECKFKSMEAMRKLEAEDVHGPNPNNQLMEQTKEGGADTIMQEQTSNATQNNPFLRSKRKTRRKGVPIRSPLF